MEVVTGTFARGVGGNVGSAAETMSLPFPDRRRAGRRRDDRPLVRVSVVIPTLNEAENLPHVLPRIPAGVHEVLLVDGHSTDGTVEVAQRLLPTIRIVQQQGKGKGAALRTGFAAVTGDIIVMLDADGSTDPAEIPYFVGALLAGADFVKGSRFLHGGGTADMPFYRRLGNLGFVMMVRTLFGGRYTDLCYGYSAFWRYVLPCLELDGNGFEIETMMNVRALSHGLRIVEVPSFEAPRVHGVSNLRTIPDGWRVVKTILRESMKPRTSRPAFTIPAEVLARPIAAVHHTVMPAGDVLAASSLTLPDELPLADMPVAPSLEPLAMPLPLPVVQPMILPVERAAAGNGAGPHLPIPVPALPLHLPGVEGTPQINGA